MSRPAAVLALLIAVSALGCPAVPPSVVPSQVAPPVPSPVAQPVSFTMSKNGVGFHLRDADARDERPPPQAQAERLSEPDTQRVLERLAPLSLEPDAEKSFALRDRSQPAPRAGKTLAESFPPPAPLAARPTPSAGAPLTVTRKVPVGPVELVPFLSVSFSAPMVAITSYEDLARIPPPVVLTPLPPGKWRWVGAQTAVFDPEPRFPMATDYTVEIPAGTRAVGGQVLASAERWSFTTSPVKFVTKHPQGGPQGLEPLVFVELDQAVDREALLATLELRADGVPLKVRAATENEIGLDPVVRRLVGQAPAGRFLVFRATHKLVPGKTYEVRLPPGTPSAEGPRRTDTAQSFSFRTYEPLHARFSCGWGSCPPSAPLEVLFNNPIDPKSFDPTRVRISPEPEALRVSLNGETLSLQGRTRGKTKYTITVSGALADTFGQALGQDVTGEITVSPAQPQLFREDEAMSVLDPQSGPVLPVFSVNQPSLQVKLYAVEPEDWGKYQAWRDVWDDQPKSLAAPPGKLVMNRLVKPAATPDTLVTTPIDLSPALRGGLGQVVVVVEPPGPPPKNRWQRQWVRTWIQVTKLGLETLSDDDSMVAWTTQLADGGPVEGVELALLSLSSAAVSQPAVRSGADGLARLPLLAQGRGVVVAKKGHDLAILPDTYAGMLHRPRPDGLRWFVFDDRHLYKPGEAVHLKGWIRQVGGGRSGDVGAVVGGAGHPVTWVMTDERGVELGKGSATVDASGGFDLVHKLPDTANLGTASIRLALEGMTIDGTHTTHAVEVQEFRRPEFEVGARAGEGPFFVGAHTHVTASASYYAGGGLPNAQVQWNVTRSVGHFVPPNRSDYAFGKMNDVWWVERGHTQGSSSETWSGRTGASGEHRMRIDFDVLDPPYPMTLSCDAAITDVNRQSWSANTTLLVHPADVYVGLKQERAFGKAGDALQVDALVVDLDGKVVAGRPVTVTSARIDWTTQQGESVEVATDEDRCVVTSTQAASHCTLKTKQGGRYRITAVVTDAQGRKNQTETHVWVIGRDDPPDSMLPHGDVRILAAKETYQGGETAELLLMAPFAPAEGLLAMEREGMVHVERFHLTSATQTVRVQVDRAWTPNVTAHVVLLGKTTREDARGVPDPKLPMRPAFAEGTVTLRIPPRDRTLDVKVKPRAEKLDPGSRTDLDIDVRDAAGAGQASTVAVVVVDEAVLALSSYTTPDPLSAFYFEREARTQQGSTIERVLVARPEDKQLTVAAELEGHAKNGHGPGKMTAFDASLRVPLAAPMAMAKMQKPIALGEARVEGPPAPIAVRKDLSALALFAPTVRTDAAGHATVPVKLPDNLTRYRVMAIAVAGERQFGSSEASLTVRLPLMVRPSAPRFLNYGDRFELPIVLQNQTDAPLSVDLAARASNASLTAGAGRRVTVPANDRVEVRLAATTVRPGQARFQVGAASGRLADAAEVSLPVWTPATTEAFATYGTIDDGTIAQPVAMPSAVEPSFGGISLTTSSTALSALSDAVLYVVRYPYECNEQLASRVLAIAALRDGLAAFNAKELPSQQVLIASMQADIKKLAARQHSSGGWDFWQPEREPWPYLSVHVAHALVRAQEKGFTVPPHTLDALRQYLRGIERHLPGWYSPESRRAILAYALYVRARMNDAAPARARQLVEEAGGVDKLPMEALGWIWPTLAADASSAPLLTELRRHVHNRVSETAGAAHFSSAYSDGAYVLLHSDRRADAILLEALIDDQPKSDLIPKLVAGLLAQRKAGRWQSIQENAFVLLGLDRYFGAFENATPDFVARAWLGERYAGEHTFKGRSAERHSIDIPMQALAAIGSGNIVLSKTGAGRLYYRLGMTYAPSDLRTPPADRGFTVTRTYEPVDDPGDLRRDPDGTWRVKAGAKVRVRVTMVAPTRRYHVALVDPLPAGLEVMNPALAVTGHVPLDPKTEARHPWPWTWYEHQNLRDERVEAFASLLWDGVHDYTYVARATTPGTFVVPPPKAEEMYSPETFGRGAADRLVVE